ncbi:MAG: chitobiase/beta-hexosaminidase C-terminal domain-containing protein, partial [Bacteroidales bacterium]|nr:chitobiase/beta-hexosaminidase C-terminal domain-containing protein [Bacteroidales bacterium]
MRKRFCSILFVLSVAFGAMAQNDTVVFSAKGGFYEDVFALELFNNYPQHHIRYTINGNRPTPQSPLYEETLVLNQQIYSKSNIYTIVNCPENEFYLPDSVQHCIVIRAAVFDENDSCVSQVMTNSYFIRALGCNTHGLPAVSLCADSLDLFDYERGIFVPGIHFDSLNPYFTGNYCMKGREWERICNIEYYELDNSGVNQQVGLRTHGKKARYQGQKGMKIYAREEYGKKRFKHRFFETLPIDKFKHLCLKPY